MTGWARYRAILRAKFDATIETLVDLFFPTPPEPSEYERLLAEKVALQQQLAVRGLRVDVDRMRTQLAMLDAPQFEVTAEQQARDMLDRLEVEDAQSYSAGDLVELANLIADASWMRRQVAFAIAAALIVAIWLGIALLFTFGVIDAANNGGTTR